MNTPTTTICTVTLIFLTGMSSAATTTPSATARLSLDEAIDRAFRHNFAVHRARLDRESAGQGVRQAWSGVFPRIDGRAAYTRTLDALNPFAGSQASDLIALGQAGIFLGSDRNPDASLREAFDRFLEAQAPSPGEVEDNPFFIENLFSAQVSATQVLYDSSLFEGIGAARALHDAQRSALRDVVRLTTRQVAIGFYGALLAQERVRILTRSELRSDGEVVEAEALVGAGLQPRTTKLAAEVQLSNTRTQRLRAENEAEIALDQLKLLLGMTIDQALELQGDLRKMEAVDRGPDLEGAMKVAFGQRPDLSSLRHLVQQQAKRAATARGEYQPRLEAFFTLRTIGQVPDDRGEDGFFSNRFWGPDITTGVVMTWNLFNGFETTSRVQQAELAEARARVDLDERLANVRLEIRRSLRNLETARAQMAAQADNVSRAELNYEESRVRVQEGVTGRAELRNASQQIDESRLNLIQAIHDYQVATIDYRVAVGEPLDAERSAGAEKGGAS